MDIMNHFILMIPVIIVPICGKNFGSGTTQHLICGNIYIYLNLEVNIIIVYSVVHQYVNYPHNIFIANSHHQQIILHLQSYQQHIIHRLLD